MPDVTPVVRDPTTGAVRNAQPGETVGTGFLPSAGGSGATPTNIQAFDSSGTWTKPAGAKKVWVGVQAGGGGGASGGRQPTGTVARGGSPGGPGGYAWQEYNADDLPASVSITVGAGGNGAISIVTDATNGGSGAPGNTSAFGANTDPHYLSATGGQPGSSTSSGAAGVGRGVPFNGISASSSGGSAFGGSLPVAEAQALPGGAGAGLATTPANADGARASIPRWAQTNAVLGVAGLGPTKANAVAPSTPFPHDYGMFGGGGPGGWSNADGTAGAGAAGLRGGGGGGGGGSLNGNPSGAGGRGGNGRVVVVSSF